MNAGNLSGSHGSTKVWFPIEESDVLQNRAGKQLIAL